ncbi:pyrroline-5-carboxylate reductase [Lactovum miscens]|uniref:Pyrroline-5-carboxylate reductase n=1 Tax=Lactovum miscens TaxID=190387 RepID=A0A841C6W1_9LACT|nr:pyrroline-5-carboxylate reductase [Lactovum miscens]MBB5888543.1 pyrroline-5-carboxylate reductase [Lactovum miscens]
MKIGFIGAGKMAQAIIAGLPNKSEILLSGRDFEKSKQTALQLGVKACQSNLELVKRSNVIILSVKPQVLPAVLKEIKDELTDEKTLVSIATGIRLDKLEEMTSKKQAIIRVMPNVNAAIQKSTSAIVANNAVESSVYKFVKELFQKVGSVFELAENDFMTFGALAGSSPAYIYMFIDAMARAGVLHGLPKDVATKIVAETVAGSAQNVIISGIHPQALADSVASPGGTTIAGIVSLEKHNFNAAVISAIDETINKEKSI